MSSEAELDYPNPAKRQQKQRACDACRRRKTRCDGPEMGKCSYCSAIDLACTYNKPNKKRRDPPSNAYVVALESRLKRMERMLVQLQPATSSSSAHRNDAAPTLTPLPSLAPVLTDEYSRPPEDSGTSAAGDEASSFPGLTQWLEKLRLNPAAPRFRGETSSRGIVDFGNHLVEQHRGHSACLTVGSEHVKRRSDFWRTQPWEKQGFEASGTCECHRTIEFPPSDLLPVLIEKYFEEINTLLPLLYRPGFERGVQESLHLRDSGFASVLFCVCALGSPFVDDTRVLLDGAPLSSGWKYFHQVQLTRKNLLAPPTLYDVQVCCLASLFLCASSVPQAYWSLIGTGIRMIQDIGVHRKQMYSQNPSVQEEQWKRAFWILVSMDLQISTSMGRPSAIQNDDIDVDLPLEVDDEYWETANPSQAFVQPPGKPARVSLFVWNIKLDRFMSYAMKIIYSIKKPSAGQNSDPEWEQRIVAELDSAMNEWADSVPEHLRWDPHRKDLTFLHQSATLWSAYYQVQIVCHRPFIPQGDNSTTMGFASLAIVLNAARASTRIIQVHQRRKGGFVPAQIPSSFIVSLVLLFNVWTRRREGLALDPAKEMEDVYHCIRFLKLGESRWPIAGRFWDVLSGLASMAKAQVMEFSPQDANKRKRTPNTPSTTTSGTSPSQLSESSDGPVSHLYHGEFEPPQPGHLQIGYGNAGFVPIEPLNQSSKTVGLTPSIGMAPSRTPPSTNLGPSGIRNPEVSLWSSPDSAHATYTATGKHLSPFSAGHSFTPSGTLHSPSGIDSLDSMMSPLAEGSASSETGSGSHAQSDDWEEWDTFFKNVATETASIQWGDTSMQWGMS